MADERLTVARSEKALIAASAHWCVAMRAQWGWSVEKLVERCEIVAETIRYLTMPPSVEEVEQLEAAKSKTLPRWLRLARYADELQSAGIEAHQRWPRPRSWYTKHPSEADPFDCCYPMLFRDEYYFLELCEQLGDARRRSLKRFVRGIVEPYTANVDAFDRLAADFGMDVGAAQAETASPQARSIRDDVAVIGRRVHRMTQNQRDLLLFLSQQKILDWWIDVATRADAKGTNLVKLIDNALAE